MRCDESDGERANLTEMVKELSHDSSPHSEPYGDNGDEAGTLSSKNEDIQRQVDGESMLAAARDRLSPRRREGVQKGKGKGQKCPSLWKALDMNRNRCSI